MKVKNNWYTSIPNILTLFRIPCAVAVCILLLINVKSPILYSFTIDKTNYEFTLNYFIAGIIFTIGALSDFLDGYLARKYQWVSAWGKIWDPITDKILINASIIVLACNNITLIWIPIIFIFRDTVVDAYRMQAASKHISVAANKWGKIKTITQLLGIIILFFIFNSTDTNTIYFWLCQNVMIMVALFFSLFSGVVYVIQLTKKIKETEKTNNDNK